MSPALLLLAAGPTAPADLAVPPGFVVTAVADNAVAPDISTMTLDPAGRVLVAGRGYVRVLTGSGAIDLIDGLKDAPMGLLAEGDALYVVADGGLRRYRGYDGKSKLKDPELLLALRTQGEHDTHAVRRGPDGWLYLLCGNMAGVKKETVTGRRSPVRDPVAGTLLRISPVASGGREPPEVEVVADGFRNAYDFDFNPDGEPFTFDSDNERCAGLPWYEPCRFYHVVPGGNYGWRSPQLGQFWRKPPYFVDCVPPVCTLGRGSPTGVACYRHTHFPEEYRGGFFLADWTFGRIHFVPLTAKGSTYVGKPEVFAEAVGTSGFAPTALAVHPTTGELYVSIGGRGTRGGVYRIGHAKSPAGEPIPVAKRSLDFPAGIAKWWLAGCASDDARVRRHALELMVRWREKVPVGEPLGDAIRPNLSHADPLVRAAAGRAVPRLGVAVGAVAGWQAKLVRALNEAADDPDWARKVALDALLSGDATAAEKLDAARVLQVALGDLTDATSVGTVFEGYTFRHKVSANTADQVLRALKPLTEPYLSAKRRTEVSDLDRELARVVAGLGGGNDKVHWWCSPWLGEVVLLSAGPTDVRDDFHFLACLARLTPYATRDEDGVFALKLLGLDAKRRKAGLPADTHWPLRIDEIAAAAVPEHTFLGHRLLKTPGFGRPEHLPLLKYLKPDRLKEAQDAFVHAARSDKDYPWTPGVVALAKHLPTDERRTLLLGLWDRADLRDAILRVLPPQKGDEPKFLTGLASFDPEVVRVSADALQKLTVGGADELVAAVKALRRLAPEDKAARAAVGALLRKRTGQALDPDPKAWAEWVTRQHPDAAKLLAAADGFDAAAWKKREAGIPWDAGDAARGKAAFAKASCAACHDGRWALGPPLAGVAKRFGRDDLIAAVVQPGKDVPARYRPTRVTTTDEKTYIGMVVYDAPDGIILQTAADTTVRLAGSAIASRRPVEASLMPAGLLDKLTDAEVADLFAYLKTLDEKRANPER
jgi:putative heme-binding domain-containing protein